jgi:hypothetical protein
MWFKFLVIFLSIPSVMVAQELFIFSEPASTMPKKAIMFRMNSRHYADPSGYYYKLNPELGYGLAKNLMGHIEGFYSNWAVQSGAMDGVGMNFKYRFFSADDLHKHKRLALTGKVIYSFHPLSMQWMLEEGNTSLASVGLIYTQLIHKLAISGKINYIKPFTGANVPIDYVTNGELLQWQLSSGLLTFPIEYKNYNQVNVNVYAEYIGQQNLALQNRADLSASHAINHDLGLGLQFIFASRFTTELAYRMNIGGTMNRMTNSMYYFNLEYMLFR